MISKLSAAPSVAAIALFVLFSSPALEAQSGPAPGAIGASSKTSSSLSGGKRYSPIRSGATLTRTTSSRTGSRRPSGARTSDSSRRAGDSSTRRSGTTDSAAASDTANTEEDDVATSDSEEAVGFAGKMRRFIKEQYVWILVVLGVGLLGVLSWIFLGSRKSSQVQPFLEPLDDELAAASPQDRRSGRGSRYSSTRIRASDVNSRLSAGVTEEEVETDREYALVVEQDALGEKEIDENTGRTYADETRIRQCLGEKDYIGAYSAYVDMLARDARSEFHTDVERELSEHFIRDGDYEKAARILEHHVATHAEEDVHTDTYFNLGYVHFQGNTVAKSRRFFQLFIEKDSRPEYVARARRILTALEGSGTSQN